VHYGREARTDACLAALDRLTWPADRRRVVMVDNGSDPSFGGRVMATYPTVRVVRRVLVLAKVAPPETLWPDEERSQPVPTGRTAISQVRGRTWEA
jgi:hypothetical protein